MHGIRLRVHAQARVESLLALLTDMLDSSAAGRDGAPLPVALRAHSWSDVLKVVEDVAKLFALPAADAGHSLSVDAALANGTTAAAATTHLDLPRLAQVHAWCVCVRACACVCVYVRVCACVCVFCVGVGRVTVALRRR